MITRASGVLLAAYLILAIAGIVFTFVPSEVMSSVSSVPITTIVWGLFYTVVGLTASGCLVARKFVKNTHPFWYFEVAGVSLIIAANLVYGASLVASGFMSGEVNVIGTGLLIVAFSVKLIGHSIQTLRLARVLTEYSKEG